jgi:hypothetical protein
MSESVDLTEPKKVRTRKFVPATFKKSENYTPKYKGYIEMRMLDYDARAELSERARGMIEKKDVAELQKVAQTKNDEAVAKHLLGSSGGISMVRQMVRLLPEYVISIQIKRLHDGLMITDLEDMLYEGPLNDTVTEVAMALVGKVELPTLPKPATE